MKRLREDGYCEKCKGTKVLLKNGVRYCGRKGCRELLVGDIHPVYAPLYSDKEVYLIKKLAFCIESYFTEKEVEEFGVLRTAYSYGIQFPEKLHGTIKIDIPYDRKKYLQELSITDL